MNEQRRLALLERVERVVRRMQTIQREIHASRQPAAQYEIAELKRLGSEYAELLAQLETQSTAGPVAPAAGGTAGL